MAAVVETEMEVGAVAIMETLALEMETAAEMEVAVEMGVETGTVEEETMDREEEPLMALLILHQ